MNILKLDWGKWLYKLAYGFIGGGASALATFVGISGAQVTGLVTIPTLDWKVWGVIFVSSGVSGALLYLKQSPLPPVEEDTNSEK